MSITKLEDNIAMHLQNRSWLFLKYIPRKKSVVVTLSFNAKMVLADFEYNLKD